MLPTSRINIDACANIWPWLSSAATAVTWSIRCNNWHCAAINNCIVIAAI